MKTTNDMVVRRRRAAEALDALPGFSCEAEILRDGHVDDVELYLPAMKRDIRRLVGDTPAARAALDALGALWAVL